MPEEHHGVSRLLAQLRLLDRATADSVPPVAHLTRYAAQYRYPPRPGRTRHLNRSDVLKDLETAREACRLLEAALLRRILFISNQTDAPEN